MSAVMSTLSIISGGRRAHRKLASSAPRYTAPRAAAPLAVPPRSALIAFPYHFFVKKKKRNPLVFVDDCFVWIVFRHPFSNGFLFQPQIRSAVGRGRGRRRRPPRPLAPTAFRFAEVGSRPRPSPKPQLRQHNKVTRLSALRPPPRPRYRTRAICVPSAHERRGDATTAPPALTTATTESAVWRARGALLDRMALCLGSAFSGLVCEKPCHIR
ncbi:hypothetical protein EVAR_41471_1 [Eumeta japonica]|uniref:Uncharacterized protein n=1 Tax=Eumeta variegata TaxID=151549 RepID=A0A4C1X3L3_EUMVA|nr:hypothetical protein EVAR_41471_1 [Eumeta japonica]